MSDGTEEGFKTADEIPGQAREPLGDLLLMLADNKRLLGIRYADWILGAPSVEAGIACSAMAQDEWGHGRILYAMLKEFGHDPERLEHEREADAYRSSELLDDPIEEWVGLLALNVLFDTALSVHFEALEESRFEPIHYKVRKLLEEERFHFEHGRGWTLRLAGTDAGREALGRAFRAAWGACLRCFGPPDDPGGRTLQAGGLVARDPDGLRARWLERVGPVVDRAGLDLARRDGAGWSSSVEPDWGDWSRERRRAPDGGPDPDTLARVRGDRNRALLLD